MEKNIEQKLKTNLKLGLKEEEAKVKLANDGLNELKSHKKESIFIRFLKEFNDVLIYILLLSGIISIILKEYTDAIIILFVVLMNGIVGFVQSEKANKAIESLKMMTHPLATVKRDGIYKKIDVAQIVVGDIVLLNEGDAVPADGIVFNSYNLLCDESSLTGESHPILKDENFVSNDKTPLASRLNEVFMSTLVLQGHSEMIVTKTGMNTEIGNIAKMIDSHKETPTPLQKKLGDLGKLLGIITIAICALLFFVALIQKRNVVEMFITSISLAVAAVPEGLPAVVTIVLAMGVQKMVKTNMIIRKLHAVETLGAVNVILTDKTGTLTENQMTVTNLIYDDKSYELSNINDNETFNMLCATMLACNSLKNDKTYSGDPLEVALLKFAKSFDKNFVFTKLKENSFSSERKMMSVLVHKNNKSYVFVKGASEEIIKKCRYIMLDNKIELMTKDKIKRGKQLLETLTSRALRVIALAYKSSEELNEFDLIFLGFVGMIDPPRTGVKESIATLNKAGIKTIMLTGDNIDTSFAIANKLKIASNKNQCIEGVEFDNLDNRKKKEIIKNKSVFARVSPKNKIELVQLFQEDNNVVAMTGDGVNDAPSLRKADVGIAMGKRGTDVAKNASDMVLLDDNYVSIVKAVKEGRGIYANIKKTTLFLLSSNFAEVMAMLVGILFGLPIPLVPVHILWINLITDSLPAIALGVDKNSDEIMNEKPRDKNESLFAKGGYKILFGYGVLITLLTLISYLILPVSYVLKNYGYHNLFNNVYMLLSDNEDILNKARTFAFVTLAMSQLFHMIGMSDTKLSVFKILKKKNVILFIAFLLGFILQMLVISIPSLNRIFHTASLNIEEWLFILLISSLPLVLHEISIVK